MKQNELDCHDTAPLSQSKHCKLVFFCRGNHEKKKREREFKKGLRRATEIFLKSLNLSSNQLSSKNNGPDLLFTTTRH